MTGCYETKSARSFLTDLSQRFRHDNISIILGSRAKAFSIRLGILSFRYPLRASRAITNIKTCSIMYRSRKIIAGLPPRVSEVRTETNTIAWNRDRQQGEVSGSGLGGWEGGRRKKAENEEKRDRARIRTGNGGGLGVGRFLAQPLLSG